MAYETVDETIAQASQKNASDNEKNQKKSLQPLLALTDYVLRYPWLVTLALLALVLSAAMMLAIPLGVRRMIDLGFSQDNAGFVDQYFFLMIFIGLVLALASASRFYCVNLLGERVVADLRADVFRHLTRLSPAFYEQTHSGEVMSRLTADTTQIKTAAGVAASQALRNLIMLFGSVFMMIWTSPKLSLLVVFAIPLIVLPLVGYGRMVRKRSRLAQDTLADASAYAAENLGALRTMQAFTHEGRVNSKFARAVNIALEAARSRLVARAILTALVIFLVFASIVGILWYGASEVFAGGMTGGHLSQFVLYAVFAAGAVGELSEVWGEVQQAAGAAERLTELMSVEPEISSPSSPVALPQPALGTIAFNNVTFTYPSREDRPALDSLSFEVETGETIAFVGPSGAGKSTVFNLILRFYDAREGEVFVDGVRVNDADLDALRKRIALVPQDPALFADTILENISYGSEGATRSEVEEAARAALAHDFISEMPEGYDTKVGERGVTLSGGQRQRIAIARALLRDAPILLLDEATSALDAESEKLVQTALDHVMKGRTTLVIAHRLATVQRADRIFVIDDGKIVEMGTHKSLIAEGGTYSRLAALQFTEHAAE